MTTREKWAPGDTAYFEYHCYEGHDSGDAQAWYRSHQEVTVICRDDVEEGSLGQTYAERAESCWPWTYTVRWADGFEYSVWEDELFTSPADYYRPNPPKMPLVTREEAKTAK